jgi:hypothetical protein
MISPGYILSGSSLRMMNPISGGVIFCKFAGEEKKAQACSGFMGKN